MAWNRTNAPASLRMQGTGWCRGSSTKLRRMVTTTAPPTPLSGRTLPHRASNSSAGSSRKTGSTAERPWPARTSSMMQPARFARHQRSRRITSSLHVHSSKPFGQASARSRATSPRLRKCGTHSLPHTSQRRSCIPCSYFYLGNLEAPERCRLPRAATRRRPPHLGVQGVYQELELTHPEKRRSYG